MGRTGESRLGEYKQMNKFQKFSVILMVWGVWFALMGVHYDATVIRFVGNLAVGCGTGLLIMERWYKGEN